MGFDAWYLTPLQRPESADDIAHTKLIDSLVGSLAEVQGHPALQTSLSSSVTEQTITEPTDRPQATETISRSMGDLMQNATTSIPASLAAKQPPMDKPSRRVIQPPPPIKLPQQPDIQPPSSNDLLFPVFPDRSQLLTWEALQAEAHSLAKLAQQRCYLGLGNSQADDFFIFPPPDRLCEKQLNETKEQQLLTEMLASIEIDWQAGYSTRLLKQATRYDKDPEAAELSTQLSLLASELALVQPRRIWLFGTLVCRSLMQSSAPLSILMNGDYHLRYSGHDGEKTAQLLCLPTVDYLLALPSEKGKVWQVLKKWRG